MKTEVVFSILEIAEKYAERAHKLMTAKELTAEAGMIRLLKKLDNLKDRDSPNRFKYCWAKCECVHYAGEKWCIIWWYNYETTVNEVICIFPKRLINQVFI